MDRDEITIDETMASMLSALANAEDNVLLLAEIGQVDPVEFRKFMAEIGEVDNKNALEILEAAESLHASHGLSDHKSKQVGDREARILIVSEPGIAYSFRQKLFKEKYIVDTAETGAGAIEMVNRFNYYVVICDLRLRDMDGMDVLRQIKDTRPTSEVIVMTNDGSAGEAVDATKAGAFWFLQKPIDFDVLMPLVERALERHALMIEAESMRDRLITRTEYFNSMGASKQMQLMYETIKSVANSNASVLIVGEPGTGKELIAKAIHYNSPRSREPLITVNCAALPKELIESELFGHTKGAFTGAHADKEGFIEHAKGGSLHLNVITGLPVELQPKLLRVLQEHSNRRIGSEKTYPVDFRLICSSDTLPADAISNGMLRDDLFYRISTVTIHVPPLREHSDDIPLLAEHFLKMYARKYERPVSGISQASYELLFAHSWPGNVRELQNVMERAVLLANGKMIEPIDLPFGKLSLRGPEMAGATLDGMTLEEIEKLVIERTLQRTGGNKQEAANILGIYRPRLYSKIRKYGIKIHNYLET